MNMLHKLIHDPLTVLFSRSITLREESSQTNAILQYKLLAAILSAVCSVIVCTGILHDEKYDCKITMH